MHVTLELKKMEIFKYNKMHDQLSYATYYNN
jgi:hypothetical protein